MFAQAADQDLAQQDDDGRVQAPGTQPVLPSQEHERGTHQQLVGNGVEHAANLARLAAGAGEMSVEIISDGGSREHDAGQRVPHRAAPRNKGYDHRNGSDPAKR